MDRATASSIHAISGFSWFRKTWPCYFYVYTVNILKGKEDLTSLYQGLDVSDLTPTPQRSANRLNGRTHGSQPPLDRCGPNWVTLELIGSLLTLMLVEAVSNPGQPVPMAKADFSSRSPWRTSVSHSVASGGKRDRGPPMGNSFELGRGSRAVPSATKGKRTRPLAARGRVGGALVVWRFAGVVPNAP